MYGGLDQINTLPLATSHKSIFYTNVQFCQCSICIGIFKHEGNKLNNVTHPLLCNNRVKFEGKCERSILNQELVGGCL